MDLREIQQLHAQFARQPITIDMPVRTGTGQPLALPSPSQVRTAARQQWSALGQRTRVLALVFGIIGVAAAGGVFVAKMQHHSTGAADESQSAGVARTSQPAAEMAAPVSAMRQVDPLEQPASNAPAVALPAEALAPASAKPTVRQEDPLPQQPVAIRRASGNGAESTPRRTTPAATPQRHPTSAPVTASTVSPQKAAAPHTAEVKMF